jgi:hypothetical protein
MRHLYLEAFPHVEYGVLNSLDWNELIVGTERNGESTKVYNGCDRITSSV